MRPVNLLPDDLRPRQGALRGSSYAVVGVLGVLLLMAVAYVLTTNKINSHKTEIAEVEQETADAEARLTKLASYEAFAQIKATRIESVKQLAAQRFDWERMMREVAVVLPEDTSVLELNAASAGAAPAGGAAPAPVDPTLAGTGGPTLQLKGCADRQPDVATLMVRLRKLYRSADVELTESTEQESAEASTPATPGAVSPEVASGDTGCPSDTYQFDMKVTFSPTDDDQKRQVPARLGGGA